MKTNVGALLLLALAGLASCSTMKVAAKRDYNFSKIRKVAVIQFQDPAPGSNSGAMVADLFAKYLLHSGITVVERNEIEKVVDELKLSMSGYIAPDQAKELGKLYGADAIITGTIPVFSEERQDFSLVRVHEIQTTTRQRPPKEIVTQTAQGKKIEYIPQPPLMETTVIDKEVPHTIFISAQVGLTCKMIDAETGEVVWVGSDTYEGVNTQVAADYLVAGIAGKLSGLLNAK